MTITQLAESPVSKLISGDANKAIEDHSKLYQVPRELIKQYSRETTKFYPLLIHELRQGGVLPSNQWLVLTESVLYTFFSFLITFTISRNLKNQTQIESLPFTFAGAFPSFQEQLIQRLSYDKKLQETLFSGANSIMEGIERPSQLTRPLSERFSLSSLQYVLTKRVVNRKKLPTSLSQNDVCLLTAQNIRPFLPLEEQSVFELDPVIQSLYKLPLPINLSLRSKLSDYLEKIFERLSLSQHFYILRDFPKSSSWFATIVASLLPSCLVEDYDYYFREISSVFNSIEPKILITSGGHHGDLSNLSVSIASSKNIPIFNFQHGAGYSELASMVSERAVEYCLYPSTFFSWGKHKNLFATADVKPKVIPIGSAYMNSITKSAYQHTNFKNILIPLEPIYFYQMLDSFTPSQPGFVQHNYRELLSFLTLVAKEHKHIRFIFKVKAGHNRLLKLKKIIPKVVLERAEFVFTGKSTDYFSSDSLVLCPNLSGAFHEVLTAEVPFIAFFPEEQILCQPFAESFISKLKKNRCVGSNSKELLECFTAHINQKVNYHKLRQFSVDYLEQACMKNPKWKSAVAKHLQPFLKKI